MNFIAPEMTKLGTSDVWTRNKKTSKLEVKEVEDQVCIIPFLPSLKQLLENDEVASKIILSPQDSSGSILKTVTDGDFYKNDDFFCKNENSLAIHFYYDDVGFTNPCRTSSSKHKYAMFYWTLGNIPPEYRSHQNSMMLLGITKTSVLKKYGLKAILQPFLKDIKILQTTGVTISVNGQNKILKGSVLFAVGDTPAQGLLGGFKESVSAYRLCRSCLTTKDDWKNYFHEQYFEARNIKTYVDQLEIVLDPEISEKSRTYWSKKYGINKKSALSEIPYFDVTQCLPQDIMHIIFEGIADIAVRNLLCYLILKKKLFTLDDFNERIRNFDFSKFFTNAPMEILELNNSCSLKQTALQMFALSHTLPFFINEWIIDVDDEHLLLHTLFLQIINMCSSYEIHRESLDVLARMIEIFISRFNKLYPNNLVPKFHFLIHVPRYIKLFGPARQHWSFSFEGFHNYFKGLVPIVRNFKNLPFTLGYRHQSKLCSLLATYPGAPAKKFLSREDSVHKGQTVLLKNLPHAEMIYNFLKLDNQSIKILRTPKVVHVGTTFEKGSIILTENNDDQLPSFSRIEEIFCVQSNIVFVCTSLKTMEFYEHLNAYHIELPLFESKVVISLDKLLFSHRIPLFVLHDKMYALLLNHERTEFYG